MTPLLIVGLLLGAEIERDSSGAVLEGSGFLKNFVSAFALGDRAGAIDAQLLRADFKFRQGDRFEAEVAYQLAFLLASDPAFLGGASLTSTVGGTGAGPQRRLVDLDATLASTSSSRLTHEIDRLALKIPLPFGDLTVGRQVLSWGTGRFFNPTDVLSPFAPTAVDREVRRGFDAVRLAIALGETTQLDLLYLPQRVAEENGGVVRFQTNLKGWDGSVSAGKYVRDFVIGADLAGDAGPLGVHAEGAYTIEWLPSGVGDHFFRGVVGADWRPFDKLVLTAEYAFNGYGSTDASQYLRILTSPRAQRGEVFGAGQHVLAIAASYLYSDVLTGTLSVLCNVTDPSALAFGTVEYSVTQTVLVRAGLSVPIGRRALRSEYGSSPFSGFVQVGLYIP